MARSAQTHRIRMAASNADDVQSALAEAEADGTREAPTYGSVWYSLAGQDKASVVPHQAHITIAVPYMILGETTLSFLGIGIRAPDVSSGSLLQQAQDIVALSNYLWVLWPAAFVFTAVVLFNFIGDGLRDAADPYAK